MLGQLAKNIARGVRDQVIGFFGFHVYVARGDFTAESITRVHSRGFSDDEMFKLKFTRGYNLCLKNDWFEIMRLLTRLFRHFLSGTAKVGSLQVALDGTIGMGDRDA